MNEKQAKRTAIMVVMASWLAVFCLFGFRATFAVLKVPMSKDMHWLAANISAGYASSAAAKATALRVAPTDATVLLLGESGVGKEVYAHAMGETPTISSAL